MKILSKRYFVFSTLLLSLSSFMFAEKVVATTCDVAISEPSVNLGRVLHPGNNAGLSSDDLYAVGTRIVSVNASCSAETSMVLVLRGMARDGQFRFAREGRLVVRLSNALLDGSPVDLGLVNSGVSAPSGVAPSIDVKPTDRVVPVEGGVAARGTVLSLQAEIRPLVPLRELLGREEASLEAHVEIEVESE